MTLTLLETTPDELMRYFLLVFGFAFCAILLTFLYFAISIVRSVRRARREFAAGMTPDQSGAPVVRRDASRDPDAEPGIPDVHGPANPADRP